MEWKSEGVRDGKSTDRKAIWQVRHETAVIERPRNGWRNESEKRDAHRKERPATCNEDGVGGRKMARRDVSTALILCITTCHGRAKSLFGVLVSGKLDNCSSLFCQITGNLSWFARPGFPVSDVFRVQYTSSVADPYSPQTYTASRQLRHTTPPKYRRPEVMGSMVNNQYNTRLNLFVLWTVAWNKLPHDIRNSLSLDVLKRKNN